MKTEELKRKRKQIVKNIDYYEKVYSSSAKKVLDLKIKLKEIDKELEKLK